MELLKRKCNIWDKIGVQKYRVERTVLHFPLFSCFSLDKHHISSSVIDLNTDSKFYTNNEDIIELVRIIGNDELSISQMMDIKKLKHRQSFVDTYLEPALKEKLVRRKYPDHPNHPRQKYLLTVKGVALYNELTKGE